MRPNLPLLPIRPHAVEFTSLTIPIDPHELVLPGGQVQVGGDRVRVSVVEIFFRGDADCRGLIVGTPFRRDHLDHTRMLAPAMPR